MSTKQVQVGWMVEADGGPMFWPLGDHAEAIAFCEDFAVPVELWADAATLEKHQGAQGFEAGASQ